MEVIYASPDNTESVHPNDGSIRTAATFQNDLRHCNSLNQAVNEISVKSSGLGYLTLAELERPQLEK
jgi:hypothetical protein